MDLLRNKIFLLFSFKRKFRHLSYRLYNLSMKSTVTFKKSFTTLLILVLASLSFLAFAGSSSAKLTSGVESKKIVMSIHDGDFRTITATSVYFNNKNIKSCSIGGIPGNVSNMGVKIGYMCTLLPKDAKRIYTKRPTKVTVKLVQKNSKKLKTFIYNNKKVYYD